MGVGGEPLGSLLTHSLLAPSSSEAEPDCSASEASSVEPCEERPWWPEPPLPPKPFTRHSSLREAPTREVSPQCPEEPQTVQGEHRACLGGRQACWILGHREGAETPHGHFFLTEDQGPVGPGLRLRGGEAGVFVGGEWTGPTPSLSLHEKLWNLKWGMWPMGSDWLLCVPVSGRDKWAPEPSRLKQSPL